MRTFERTHSWISFRIDLRKAPPRLWMLLGEAASKCEHIAGVPLRPATAESLHKLYLANQPFNMSDWGGENLRQDLRWKFEVPPVNNAN